MSYMMRLKKLTLVVQALAILFMSSLALAKPHYDTPLQPSAEVPTDAPINPKLLDNTAITTVPAGNEEGILPREFDRSKYHHADRQSLALYLGLLFGDIDTDEEQDRDFVYIFGLSHVRPSDFSPFWEIDLSFSIVGHMHLAILRRHVWQEKSAFRPFVRYGLNLQAEAEERFAFLSNWDNYMFKVSVGAESTDVPPRSARLAIDVAAGKEDFFVGISLGNSWGF